MIYVPTRLHSAPTSHTEQQCTPTRISAYVARHRAYQRTPACVGRMSAEQGEAKLTRAPAATGRRLAARGSPPEMQLRRSHGHQATRMRASVHSAKQIKCPAVQNNLQPCPSVPNRAHRVPSVHNRARLRTTVQATHQSTPWCDRVGPMCVDAHHGAQVPQECAPEHIT